MWLRLLAPDERPAFAPGRPRVWSCPAGSGNGRAGLRRQARLLLAGLLSHYLDCPPERLGLVFEAGEPPGLAARWQGLPLALSISYSATQAAVAICPGAPVGIDLAQVAPMPDWRPVARLYLGPVVEQQLAGLPDVDRDLQFARAWAAQEARLKAIGLPLQEWSAALQRDLDAAIAGGGTLELDQGRLVLALACSRG